MMVGRWPDVRGRAIVTATDARCGSSLILLSLERTTLIQGTGRLRIGNGVFLNSGTRIDCWDSITLGNRVIVGQECILTDSDMHGIAGVPVRTGPIVVGDGTWLGARVTVLKGVTIGSRVVVGTGSVVTHDIPDDSVAVGNPARVIRTLEYPPGQLTAWTT